MTNKRRKEIEKLIEKLNSLIPEVEAIHNEEETAYYNLPENLQNSIRGDVMEANVAYLADAWDSIEEAVKSLKEAKENYE